MKILLTGSSGLLGKHLKIEAERPRSLDLNIEFQGDFRRFEGYDLIVHAAAYTKVEAAETERRKCYETNVTGTLNLLLAYPNTPFIFISSEYSHNPINFYSLTKAMAEQLVMSHTAPWMIIRTLFKPYPWPYEKAFKDQFTQGGYVTEIAPKIDKAIMEWDKKSKLIYIGTGRRTMLELAQETKPDVIPNSIKEMKVKIPSDYR